MNAANTLGYSTGWRQPTQDELVALYANRASVQPSGWGPTGWTLNYAWSSTDNGVGIHYVLILNNGIGFFDFDSSVYYGVSCVH